MNKEQAWDFESLNAWFSSRQGRDVLETELLKVFFPAEDPFAGGYGMELFQKHFLLYRRLWIFDDELRTTTGHRLWIRGIRCTLLEPPPVGSCGWLDPESGQYCQADAFCPHSDSVPTVNSMKSYYLNWSNLEGMTEENLRKLMEKGFQWIGRSAAVTDALNVFGLPSHATPTEIRSRWRQLCKDHHPDKGGDSARFQTLSSAWNELKVWCTMFG